jgi:CcdB protein
LRQEPTLEARVWVWPKLGHPVSSMYLTPSVTFAGESYVLMTPLLAGVALTELGSHVGSIAEQERVIMAALNFLFEGF